MQKASFDHSFVVIRRGFLQSSSGMRILHRTALTLFRFMTTPRS